MNKVKLAIIGCGAVAQKYHIPAVTLLSSEVELTCLVDPDIDKVTNIAKRLGVRKYYTDYKKVIGQVDAAILAVPHSLHAQIGIELLEGGVHVLCEKPLAITSKEALQLVNAARSNNRILGIGYYRRFIPAARLLKALIAGEFLGQIQRIDVEEGFVYNWPAQTFSFWDRAQAGGGVLLDTGSHVLDLVLWWLGWPSEIDILDYDDDGCGGVEAVAKLSFIAFIGGTRIPVTIKLSRLRRMRNSVVIYGEHGNVEWEFSTSSAIKFVLAESLLGREVQNGYLKTSPCDNNDVIWYFVAQLQTFVESVRIGRYVPPLASGDEGMRTVKLIEMAYENKVERAKPWLPRFFVAGKNGLLTGKSVLVTGASGFLGCSVVERLLEEGADVHACVHNLSHASRLARLPVKMVRVDLRDRRSLEDAVKGCDFVVHCAFSSSDSRKDMYETNVIGMRNLCELSLQKRVKRLVHISSVAVYYGIQKEGVVYEDVRLRRTGIPYCDVKIELEKIVYQFMKYGLPCVILRPGNIYGPYSLLWLLNPLERIKLGLPVVINGGLTPSNTVYVRNVVDAVVRSLLHEGAVGNTFNVTDVVEGSSYTTWMDFYRILASLFDERIDVKGIEQEQIVQLKREYLRRFIGDVVVHSKAAVWRAISEVAVQLKRSPGAGIVKNYLPKWLVSYVRRLTLSGAIDLDESRSSSFIEYPLYLFDKLYVVAHTIPSIYISAKASEVLGYMPIGLDSILEELRLYLEWEFK